MRSWQRRIGLGAAALAALVILVIGGVYGMSASAVSAGHDVASHAFDASTGDADSGARLAVMFGCTDCHTPDLGGQLLLDGMPFARVTAPNLTAGAAGGAFTDAEFERAVRHGIGRDGRKLFIMPSGEYTYLSDQDVADILTWIRTLPSVERELPTREFGPIGRTMVALGRVPFQPDLIAEDPDARHLDRPADDDLLRLGHYYTRLCTGCHGLDLAGGQPIEPGAPPAPNLTPAGNLRNWSLDEFRTVFMTGRTPEGKQLNPAMPWALIGTARPHEIEAIWTYLRSVPATDGGILE